MGFHHVALATKDLAATHKFYTEVMGFSLVKTIIQPLLGTLQKHLTSLMAYGQKGTLTNA